MVYRLKAEKVSSVRAPHEDGVCRESRIRSHNITTIFSQVTLDIALLWSAGRWTIFGAIDIALRWSGIHSKKERFFTTCHRARKECYLLKELSRQG